MVAPLLAVFPLFRAGVILTAGTLGFGIVALHFDITTPLCTKNPAGKCRCPVARFQ